MGKLQEGRRRNAKNNEVKLEDIINYCEFGGRIIFRLKK